MGILCYILGRTGTGKSYSLRNFPQDEVAVVNVVGKVLPFRGSAKITQTATDNSDEILKAIDRYSKEYKAIVVDDFQYVMSNEFMRRAMERGYDKFTEIAAHAWNIADKVRTLPSDCIVYVMCHTDTDQEGTERLKTIGKLLDEKIYLEGMSTIVLKTVVSDGKYSFATQNNGKDTVKSPAEMFPSLNIDNDLYYVDQKIREYYGLDTTMSADDLAKADEDVAQEIEKPTKKRRGTVKVEEPTPEPIEEPTLKEEPQEAEEPEAVEEPKKTRRVRKSQATKDAELEEQMLEAEGMTRKVRETVNEPTATDDEPAPRRRRRRV